MAQGFVKNLNLVESATQTSDRTILDNLGGENITSDVLLFDGNSKFKSALENDSDATTGNDVFYGNFVVAKVYKITEFGTNRNWASIGNFNGVTPAQGVVFTATADGQAYIATGEGGIAREVSARVDFNNVNDVTDGFTIVVVGTNKVAYSDGTEVSFDGGTNYTHIVTNSNGEDKFQLLLKGTTTPIVNIADVVADINDCTMIRNDTIDSSSLGNLNVVGLTTNDEEEAGFSTDPESIVDEADGEVDVDQGFQVFDQAAYIGNIVSKIKFKKTRIPLTYEDTFFNEKVRFKGEVRLTNNNSLEIGYPRTITSALVVGEEYEIITKDASDNAFFNTVAQTSNVTYNVGDKFTARTSDTGSGTSTVKATNPPGLFIYNEASGTEIRAFSGTDNPWEEVASPPSFILGNSSEDNALKTTSATSQVARLIFDPSDNAKVPHLVKTNSGQSAAVDLIVTEDSPTFTHKLPVTVNGEQFFFLLKP